MIKILRILLAILLLIVLSAAAFSAIRIAVAQREIAGELQTIPDIVPTLAATTRLEVLPLYEAATASGDLLTGAGVSYLVRTDSATILFDVGHNPDQLSDAPFLQNMAALGVSFDEVDRVVISHPHPDHVGGGPAWLARSVYAGNQPLIDLLGDRLIFVPAPVSFKGAVHATIPSLPAPDIATTGVLPFAEVFPLSLLQPKNGEQALVVRVDSLGLVLITGCGHPGLETLIERAETLYGQPVAAVVGGLHYTNAAGETLHGPIEYLQAREPVLVALSPHDSGPQAQQAFADAFGAQYATVRVGETLQLP